MKQERRKHERFIINQMVDLSGTEENFISARGLNISEGGILCLTDDSVDTLSRIFVMMTLVEGDAPKTLSCEGVVVRCEKKGKQYETAMEFSELTDESRAVIKHYVKSHKSK